MTSVFRYMDIPSLFSVCLQVSEGTRGFRCPCCMVQLVPLPTPQPRPMPMHTPLHWIYGLCGDCAGKHIHSAASFDLYWTRATATIHGPDKDLRLTVLLMTFHQQTLFGYTVPYFSQSHQLWRCEGGWLSEHSTEYPGHLIEVTSRH